MPPLLLLLDIADDEEDSCKSDCEDVLLPLPLDELAEEDEAVGFEASEEDAEVDDCEDASSPPQLLLLSSPLL